MSVVTNRAGCLAVGLALALGSRHARAAEPTPEDVERARTFYDAGAQAYAAERWTDAVRAFDTAQKIAPRASIVFSLAQAERKAYLTGTGDVRMLRSAVQHYREYLELVPKGGRRSDALEAKDELEARLARLDPQQQATAASPAPAADRRKPRVTVISATPGARVAFDGGAPQELPLVVELDPGRHSVRLFAEGFVDDVQEVSGDKGIDIPLNVPLREKPARLDVALAARGELLVDGRLVASTPVSGPIAVAPGVHVVSVSVNGKRAWSQEITFVRDRGVRIEPRLERSDQRLASWVVLGGGAVAGLVGVLTGLGALGEEARAKDIEEAGAKGNIDGNQLARHNDAIDKRDSLRTTSLVTLAAGGTLLAGGALLYVFDRPSIAVVPPRPTEQPRPKAPSLELTASPVLAPGTWGGAVVGVF